jgi:hypothetical protein
VIFLEQAETTTSVVSSPPADHPHVGDALADDRAAARARRPVGEGPAQALARERYRLARASPRTISGPSWRAT